MDTKMIVGLALVAAGGYYFYNKSKRPSFAGLGCNCAVAGLEGHRKHRKSRKGRKSRR